MFPITSRYHGIEIAKYQMPDGTPCGMGKNAGEAEGQEIVYLRRRFLPLLSTADNDPVFAQHTVTQGERLDNITARHLGDPEQFWRVCDTNNAMNPQELTAEIGRRLRISFPQGGVI